MNLTAEVKDVLERSSIDGTTLTLPEKLSRPLYLSVAKALECLGGKWDKKTKRHVFADHVEDVLADAISTGRVVDHRKEFQFYETPEPLAKRLVDLADIKPGMRVLEPSAGGGRIANAITNVLGAKPFVCELEDARRRRLFAAGFPVVKSDFLDTKERFDRIIMNPPFTRLQDVQHVWHAFSLLNKGGVVVAVMSPAWKFRQPAKHSLCSQFREFVQSFGSWEELPEGSFAESGTGVRTGIVVARP